MLYLKEQDSRSFPGVTGGGPFSLHVDGKTDPDAGQIARAIVDVDGTVQNAGYSIAGSPPALTFTTPLSGTHDVTAYYPGPGNASLSLHLIDATSDPLGIIPISAVDSGTFATTQSALLGAGFSISMPAPISTTLGDLLDVSFDGKATANLDVAVGIDEKSGDWPSINGNLYVDWGFHLDHDFKGDTPTVELRDVTLNLGHGLSRIVGSVVQDFQDFIAPIKPVLDFLGARSPSSPTSPNSSATAKSTSTICSTSSAAAARPSARSSGSSAGSTTSAMSCRWLPPATSSSTSARSTSAATCATTSPSARAARAADTGTIASGGVTYGFWSFENRYRPRRRYSPPCHR